MADPFKDWVVEHYPRIQNPDPDRRAPIRPSTLFGYAEDDRYPHHTQAVKELERLKSMWERTKGRPKKKKEMRAILGDDAQVFGPVRADRSCDIEGTVIGKSRLTEDSEVGPRAVLRDSELTKSTVGGKGCVEDSSLDNSRVWDDAEGTQVSNSSLTGSNVGRNAEVRGSQLFRSKVTGNSTREVDGRKEFTKTKIDNSKLWNSNVSGSSEISNSSLTRADVKYDAKVEDSTLSSCLVDDSTKVKGSTLEGVPAFRGSHSKRVMVRNQAQVLDSTISGECNLEDGARVEGSTMDTSTAKGNAQVYNSSLKNTAVSGDAVILGGEWKGEGLDRWGRPKGPPISEGVWRGPHDRLSPEEEKDYRAMSSEDQAEFRSALSKSS